MIIVQTYSEAVNSNLASSRLFQLANRFGSATRTTSALSGLLLIIFLISHLSGLALAPLAPFLFETYVATLHNSTWLSIAELALFAVAVVHLGISLLRAAANRAAGNTAILLSRRSGPLANLSIAAARNQAAGGLILLIFLLVHLAQLRWHRPPLYHELAALEAILASPWSLALYMLAAVAVALHIFHGGEAAHRSLGLLQSSNASTIRSVIRLLALFIGAGFMSVTLALALQSLDVPSAGGAS